MELSKKYLAIKSLQKKGEFLKACQETKSILKTKISNPLKSFFKIKILEFCSFEEKYLSNILKETELQTPSWLKEYFLKTALSISTKNNLKKESVKFIRQLTQYTFGQKEKIKLLKKGLKIDPKDKKTISLLYKVAPRLNEKITNKNAYAIGRDLEKVREFKKARKVYSKIIKAKNISFKEKVKSLKRIKKSYKNQRNRKQYLKEIKRMGLYLKKYWKHSKFSTEAKEAWWENEIGHARAIWTMHKRKKGAKILKNLIKEKEIPPYSHAYALFILASMEIEKKDFNKAISYLNNANSIDFTDKKLREKISWSIGWNLFLLNKFKESASYFNKEKKKNNNYFFNLKLNFWESIALEKMGKEKKAEALWMDIYKKNPYSYYGIISRLKLNKPFEPLDRSPISSEHVKDEESKVIDFFISTDELKLAKKFLSKKSTYAKNISELKSLIPLYNKLKWHKGLLNKFYSIEAVQRVPHTKDFFNHLFPTPFKFHVDKASKKFNIEKELIYSITRQESAFELYSRSFAEAYGPMQITPENASRLSKTFNIVYNNPTDLFSPKVNFLMGSALLKKLQERFNDKFIFYVAAYNASKNSVERWAQERYNGDPLQFIELIPYNETKNYVKLVLRNYINYKRLNSKGPFYFPKDIL